jgi:hypothetical protein
LLVPGIFTLWLAAHGVLGDAWYGLAGYNVGGGATKRHAAQQLLWFLILAACLIAFCVRQVRRRALPAFDWSLFFVLQGGLYLLLIWFVWPLITKQDFLPVLPTLAIAIVGGLSGWRWLQQRPALRAGCVVLALAIELVVLIAYAPPWRDELAAQRVELAMVLHYTDPGDTVMDPKGDTIFRQRPFYPVIESLAMLRLRRGQMADTIADDLVQHRTMLVVARRLPRDAGNFVTHNYVPAGGDVMVAGRMLSTGEANQAIEVHVPGDYVLTDGHQRLSGSLDGAPPADHWELTQGVHHLEVSAGVPVALVWTQAFDRGWRPQSPEAH